MEDSVSLYLLTSFLTFVVVLILIFLIKREKGVKKISFLEGASFILVITGIAYGSTSAFGYTLVCGGVIFMMADLFVRFKDKKLKKRK
ncbi:hypothetical protein J4411_01155 [Candidatus Pacearchaeota archaeon]|nr:hypothetical protein [Candidatus Pacearchaeota archaeon]